MMKARKKTIQTPQKIATKALYDHNDNPLQNHRTVETRLKWFNQPKGFGFVVPDDNEEDAFLHITALQKVGLNTIGENARLICEIETRDKGAIVTSIESVLDVGEIPDDISQQMLTEDCDMGETYILSGVVKWYKPKKDYGFISPNDGMKDVFIHQTCLAKLGIKRLYEGQKVEMLVRNVLKGREVIKLKIMDSAQD